MKCIDTTYFVDLIRRPQSIRKISKKLDDEGIHATTAFNVYEAFFGAYNVKEGNREKIVDKLNRAMERLEILDFTHNDALLAAKIGGELARNGKHIGADAIIAAIAVNNGCKAIVTTNEKHFKWTEEIIELKVETY